MTTNSSRSLPSDIELHERKLLDSRAEVERLRKFSDGLLGPIGLDATVRMIPFVGDLYTVLASSWLFILARRTNAPLGDLFFLLLLSIADFMVGEISGPGDIVDAFFRVHGWFGGRLVTHIDMYLSLIENARFQIGQNRDLDLIALRESLSIKG